MKRAIQDEFTSLKISRQRKWQLRRERDGLCVECGAPATHSNRCVAHLVKAREYQRKKGGFKRRYNTISYRLANSQTV